MTLYYWFDILQSIPFGNKIRGERGLVFTYSENYKHEPLYTISLVVYERDGRASQRMAMSRPRSQ